MPLETISSKSFWASLRSTDKHEKRSEGAEAKRISSCFQRGGSFGGDADLLARAFNRSQKDAEESPKGERFMEDSRRRSKKGEEVSILCFVLVLGRGRNAGNLMLTVRSCIYHWRL